MPVPMVERRYADELDVDADSADGTNRINADEDVSRLSCLPRGRRSSTTACRARAWGRRQQPGATHCSSP